MSISLALPIVDQSPDLAAFATALERRRTDYATLLRGLTFPRPSGADVVPAFEEFLPQQKDRLISIEESNALVSSTAVLFSGGFS